MPTIDEQEKYKEIKVFVTLALFVHSKYDPPCGNCQPFFAPQSYPTFL